MAVFAWIQLEISKQYGHMLPWGVVFYGIGTGLYFNQTSEPDFWIAILGLIIALGGGIATYQLRYAFGLVALLPALVLSGFSIAALNARSHAAPVLDFHYYGPINGRVVGVDRSGSHAMRLTLDHVLLSDVPKADVPHRIRVTLHGTQEWLEPRPGQYVGLTGHLSGPNGPVEPGGFDFQRHAWFLRLGAVGYTRTPVLEMKPPEGDLPILSTRRVISEHVARHLPGDIGGFAAAVTTGDRSAFSQEAIEALRVSNLAHLLAISGLHMGLLATFLFGVFRLALSLWQPWALRLPSKKIAALAALAGATGYLLLSGASIATQRAYVMAAVALIAVSLDRRALTLRSVAIAGLIVLVLKPSSLLSPGFQMSFAATTALVFVFSALQNAPDIGRSRWLRAVGTLVLSSFVAGLATAPFAAAHFNQWASYGFLANVAAVPAMGTIVIPGAVLAALLAPIGLDWIGLEVMGIGLRWILAVATWVSDLEGARVPIVTPPHIVLPLLSLGGCWFVLWQGALKWGGALAFIISLLLWVQVERPDILISGDGKLVGVKIDRQRALSKARGQGFVAGVWLENDGDAASQPEAAARATAASKGIFSITSEKRPVVHFQGKKGAATFQSCLPDEIVITDQSITEKLPCALFDQKRLGRSGATAIWFSESEMKIRTVSETRGQRLWTPSGQRVDLRDQ